MDFETLECVLNHRTFIFDLSQLKSILGQIFNFLPKPQKCKVEQVGTNHKKKSHAYVPIHGPKIMFIIFSDA